MEFYPIVNKNEIITYAGKWIGLKIIVLSKVKWTLEDKYKIFSLIQKNLDLNISCFGFRHDMKLDRHYKR